LAATPPRSNRIAALAARLLEQRWFARAPIWIYRARLGFLMGSRVLMLEHIGRRSGARRYAILEVVDQPAPGRYVVASGFGERSQWLRNVRANPSVRVSVGRQRSRPATARPLDPAEAQAALREYARKHPVSWRTLRPVFESTLGTEISDDTSALPLVCIDTTADRNKLA
jgi:deazaflavin-dependent oxidoreductase (nitroreductase family)